MAGQIAPPLLAELTATSGLDELAARALSLLAERFQAAGAWVVRGSRGRWRVVGGVGIEAPLPEELLGEALDGVSAVLSRGWASAPLYRRAEGGQLLLLRLDARSSPRAEEVAVAALVLGDALAAAQRMETGQKRADRLDALLEISTSWRQNLDMETLLTRMAEASTRLMQAERASIFLWDRPHHQLVGRPALGVDEGELRVPDDAGVVGRVLKSGQVIRVDRDEDQSQIDRQVDRELGFQTRSLLCAPLRGQQGELFGAFELINKIGGSFTDEDEIALEELAAQAAIALENTQQYEQLIHARNQMTEQAAGAVQLVGNCPAIEALRSTIRRVADTDLAILLLGENGTGKEVVSRMIHYMSSRRHEPLVAVNCAAMSETLLESELFGHEKGAFTDARETRVGKFEQASGGTLFLDEIGDMSPGGQAKLLRVLEEKVVVRVGGSVTIPTDTRVIAATNQSLVEMVRNKTFREDLYFRLNVVTLELPPLRERGDDILLLAEHFLRDLCVKARRPAPKFTAAAQKRLLGHAWPGNVRELRNLMERLAYLTSGDKVDADELAFILSPDADSSTAFSWDLSLTEATRQFQIECIRKQIQRARGNMTEAAKRLGLHRSNLYRKMRQLGMDVAEEE
jgi:Nif-specific regulatory protein